jgi:hypothetical protein
MGSTLQSTYSQELGRAPVSAGAASADTSAASADDGACAGAGVGTGQTRRHDKPDKHSITMSRLACNTVYTQANTSISNITNQQQ